MTKLPLKMLVSLVTGLCFAAGVAGGFLVFEKFSGSEARELIHVNSPEGIEIIKHSRIPNRKLVVSGVVLNQSEFAWENVSLQAVIFADSSEVNRCYGRVYDIPKGAEKTFNVECQGVDGTNLPRNIRYEIYVKHAYRPAST